MNLCIKNILNPPRIKLGEKIIFNKNLNNMANGIIMEQNGTEQRNEESVKGTEKYENIFSRQTWKKLLIM